MEKEVDGISIWHNKLLKIKSTLNDILMWPRQYNEGWNMKKTFQNVSTDYEYVCTWAGV